MMHSSRYFGLAAMACVLACAAAIAVESSGHLRRTCRLSSVQDDIFDRGEALGDQLGAALPMP